MARQSRKTTTTKKTPATTTPAKKTPATTAKKTPAKRSPAKKTPANKSPANESPIPSTDTSGAVERSTGAARRIEQITRLLQELDENALDYIASQVALLVHQQRTGDRQEEVSAAQDAVMHGEAPAGAASPGYSVDIEQISPQSFVIKVAGERIYFSRDELRAITKIAWGTEEPATAAERLYRWFDRERRDFLLDTGIDGVRDRALEEIHRIIRSRYSAR